MSERTALIEEIIGTLNRALTLDHDAVKELFDFRVVCNEELSKHPTIQCGMRSNKQGLKAGDNTYMPDDIQYVVGFLGLLNGLLATDENGVIDVDYEAGCKNKCENEMPGSKGLFKLGYECPVCGELITEINRIRRFRRK